MKSATWGAFVFASAIPVFAQLPPVVVTVDACLPPLTTGLTATASGPRPDGACTYMWSLSGGFITGGQNSDTLTFSSGPPGTEVSISAEAVGPSGCFGIGHATSTTQPEASATGGATICAGSPTPLAGSGGPFCLWTPAEGLDDPNSCTPMASPTRSTIYRLVVADATGCPSTNDAWVRIIVPFERRGVSVDRSLPPNTSELTASSLQVRGCSVIGWSIQGGTITSEERNRVTFTSGPPGTRVTLKSHLLGNDICPPTLVGHAQVDFADVPPDDLFYEDVAEIGRRGITAGCGSGRFCPGDPVRRDQTAVLLMKAKVGTLCAPPSCEGLFTDVPCASPFASWVEMLAERGITAGCGGGTFCPDRHVTRAQMAAFLLKAVHGSDFTPPPCTNVFADVACPGPFADWIEAAYFEEMVGPCEGDPLRFCPDIEVTRAWMTRLLVKAFHFPLN